MALQNYKRQPFLRNDNSPTPFISPPNFSSITYEVKSDIPIPMTRRDHRQPDFSQNNKNTSYTYPIHKPTNPAYNLLCSLDKMKVGDYIQLKDRDNFQYAYTRASMYAAALRRDKSASLQHRFRGHYDPVLNIGRIWRIA